MKVYCYDDWGIFSHVEEALIDPLESKKEGVPVCLIPAQSTILEPLAAGENEVNVFDGKKWVLEKDYRGLKQYNAATRQIDEIKCVGDLADGCFVIRDAEIAMINDYTVPVIEDDKLVVKVNLERLKEYKLQEINQMREKVLETEFVEFAGDLFDVSRNSVINLTALVNMASLRSDKVFLYRSKNNVNHEFGSEDIINLGSLATSKVDEIYKKSWELKERIKIADGETEVMNVVWE